ALSRGRRAGAEGVAQALLDLRRQVRLDDDAAVRADAVDQRVACLGGPEDDQRGGAGTQVAAELLEEDVVDAVVAELAAEPAARRADRRPEEGSEEEQPDGGACQRALAGARLRRAPQ